MTKYLEFGIPNLLINLMSCHCFLKNNCFVVILKFPKRMLEYHYSKCFTLFECNIINLEKLPNEVKDRIHAEDIDNSFRVMKFTTTISSI